MAFLLFLYIIQHYKVKLQARKIFSGLPMNVLPGVCSERRHENLRDFLKGRHEVFLFWCASSEPYQDWFVSY